MGGRSGLELERRPASRRATVPRHTGSLHNLSFSHPLLPRFHDLPPFPPRRALPPLALRLPCHVPSSSTSRPSRWLTTLPLSSLVPGSPKTETSKHSSTKLASPSLASLYPTITPARPSPSPLVVIPVARRPPRPPRSLPPPPHALIIRTRSTFLHHLHFLRPASQHFHSGRRPARRGRPGRRSCLILREGDFLARGGR